MSRRLRVVGSRLCSCPAATPKRRAMARLAIRPATRPRARPSRPGRPRTSGRAPADATIPFPRHSAIRPVKSLFGRASQPDLPSPGARALDPSEVGLNLHTSSKASESVFGGPGILAVKGLQKSYRSRTVVHDAALNVRAGEAVGLLGPNGAGKTTIFYMITGLVSADRGVISLDGHVVTRLPMYRRARLGIGYLPQEASIFRGLNVEDNIRAALGVVEPSRKQRERKLDSLLEEFNIARLRKAPSIALSGGERRRCEIARALAGDP